MSRVLDEDLVYEILSVVEEIPEGNVATYGQIARLIGRPKNSRLVGKVLSMSQFYGDYPCHRVVNREGKVAEGFAFGGSAIQRKMLEDEGIVFEADGHIDLEKYLWKQ